MVDVKLKIHPMLFNSSQTLFEEISVTAREDESVLEMVARLAREDKFIRNSIFDEKNQLIREEVFIINNECLVRPNKLIGTLTKDNDEIIFVPFLHGG